MVLVDGSLAEATHGVFETEFAFLSAMCLWIRFILFQDMVSCVYMIQHNHGILRIFTRRFSVSCILHKEMGLLTSFFSLEAHLGRQAFSKSGCMGWEA